MLTWDSSRLIFQGLDALPGQFSGCHYIDIDLRTETDAPSKFTVWKIKIGTILSIV